MTHRTRLSSLIWYGAVGLAMALSLVLMLQVKAVNSEIAETEKAIVSAKQQIAVLETEFQTRARQQQLVRWNEVDFGYVAPKASQFLDGRAQLAALGKPVEIIEAAPIRMAEAAQMPEQENAGTDTTAAAPVRMASADDKPVLKGKPEEARADVPVRLAQAPAMMRQLVARDAVPAKADTKSVTKGADNARGFAERFDLDTVIAEGKN